MTDVGAVVGVVAVSVATAGVASRGLRVSRTRDDFLVAARQVPSALNAAAISGEYLSAASFLGVAGLAMADGIGALWYAVGYAAGYLVLLAVIAAPLRRFGAYTIPDFAEGRLDSPLLRKVATGFVLVICGFYLLPQMEGAGVTLQVAFGGPYWVGVVVLGVVVTGAIASGGMKGITFVQSFEFWLKLVAIALPAVALVAVFHHPSLDAVTAKAPAVFERATTVRFAHQTGIRVTVPVRVVIHGNVDGSEHQATPAASVELSPGVHQVGAGSSISFPAGSAAPTPTSGALTNRQWLSPLLLLGGRSIHPLAATYGIILATFFGALGLPHILVRFYTNPDGQTARRTTAIVVMLLSCFYVWPALLALLGRVEAPGLYLSKATDTVVLVLPRLAVGGVGERILSALVAGGAFAAFLSTSSGLLIATAGALSHDILSRGVKAFRLSALGAGLVVTVAGLAVRSSSINVLVGWAFAVAASSFCPLLILGIWWTGLTRRGALAGLLLGGGSASAAVIAAMAGVATGGWPAVLVQVPAIWTVPLAFTTMIVVSVLTPRSLPPDVMGKLRALHLPEALRQPGLTDP